MTEEREQSPSLREEAARWLVRLRSGEATADDRRRLNNWLAEDPSHRQEFGRVSGMWTNMTGAKPLFETELRKAETRWAEYASTSEPAAGQSWWSPARMVAAGALMGLITLTTLWWVNGVTESLHYQTAKGEQRQLTLSDGSSVMMNTNTQMTVEFSSKTRAIRLDQGEAWFTVAQDGRRPFEVEVANGIIHDIGTQFIVSKSSQQVEVSVLDGIVEVALHPPVARHAILHRGQRVSYGMDGWISEVGPFDQITAGAWKDGKLIFKGHPLAQVLNELARYRTEEIRLLDNSLKDVPVTGVFNIRELENSLELLQDALPIRAQRVNANLIIVERASPSTTAPRSRTR
ncbi:FecR family protein [Nitrospira sp. KM1]|uniref:FecR family protein n=1 Tax=Nitrospira sp. KM1 TaxID=1936990 RepID=UPI0015643A41|nr:FecR family protein [Nitrospira sp. KM1]